MSKIADWVKEHPYESAGIAAVAVLGFILYTRSASETTSTVTSDSAVTADEVAASSQLQQAQITANQQALASNNSAAVANNQITSNDVIAGLQSQDTLAGISATATTTQQANTLSAQTTQAVSALQAQVAENQTNAQVQQTQINDAAYVDIASLPYDSVTPQLIAAVNQNTQNLAALGSFTSGLAGSLSSLQSATSIFEGSTNGTFAAIGRPNAAGMTVENLAPVSTNVGNV